MYLHNIVMNLKKKTSRYRISTYNTNKSQPILSDLRKTPYNW